MIEEIRQCVKGHCSLVKHGVYTKPVLGHGPGPMAHPKFYIFTPPTKGKENKKDLLTLMDQALKDRAIAAMFCIKLIPRLFTALLFKMTGQY